LALDRLGVDETDAEFEVLDEPKPGLFGRLRGEARVRARVRPTRPRPKAERRERRKPKDTSKPEPASADAPAGDGPAAEPVDASPAQEARPKPARTPKPRPAPASEEPASDGDAEQEAEAARAFLVGLVAAFGLEASADIVPIDTAEAEIRVEGDDLGLLIGPRGQTLLAVQDLTRLAAQPRNGARHGRLRVDIGGYRQRREAALVRFTERLAGEVVSTGTSRALEPMAAADRKIVHDAANLIPGVTTESEGEEPFRRVVIRPAATAEA
jgi:spoIIIJ-associated protein